MLLLACPLAATAAPSADLDESGVADTIADYAQGRFDLARRQFEPAAAAGSAAAQYRLGLMHARGEGTPRDLWFSAAVTLGWWKAREARERLVPEMTPQQVARATARYAEPERRRAGPPDN